jgi:hypothetical protein
VGTGLPGHLEIRHDPGLRATLLWVQLGLVALVVVLALPQARTGADDIPDEPAPRAATSTPRVAASR